MNFSSPHRRIDQWIRSNPFRVDLIAGAIYTLIFAGGSIGLGYGPYTGTHLLVLAFAQTAPLMVRRRFPWAVTAFVIFAHLVQVATYPGFLPSQVSVPILVYTIAVYGKRWQSLFTLTVGIIGALLITIRTFTLARAEQWISFDWAVSFVGLSLIVLVCWTFGDLARTRRLAVESLRDRATRLEMERQYERDLAASDERNHIAREMHDIVAHSLSVIITQADGARYAAAKDPQIAIDTLKTVADTGRSSLREMRRLLGVLRTDEAAENRPLPTLADIAELVNTTEHSGVPTELVIDGTPRRELPAGAELTAYRCVQESLTNVLKHAGAHASAQVLLSWNGKGLDIQVTDNGRGAGALAQDGAGQGLRGMGERVALYDGRTTAAPLPGGGFQVSVFIPYSED